jgi:6-phosphogluconate dehydrogenase
VFESIDLDVPAPVIALSLMRRIGSRDEIEYADRLLSALRHQFGGHAVEPEA